MIELVDVSKRYSHGVAVDRVSLRVEDGELLVLLGSSGSGKTTTLKMINRLLEPSEGTIRLDGEDVRDTPPAELRRRIGYVFQKLGLFPHLTVAQNVGITPALQGRPRAWIEARVDQLLELVELDPGTLRERLPEELSGGQRQRVAVARALAAEPRIMLLDEPFGALDPLTRDRLQQSFLSLHRRLSMTAIFVTHDMVEALILGDRIAVMEGGRVVQVGAPRDLLENPAAEIVEQLMSTPRRQSRIVDALMKEPKS